MEAKLKPRSLEIMVISGENLCVDQAPLKENAYVVVRSESLSCCTTRMAMAKEGGGGSGSDGSSSNSSSSLLSWNEKLLLDVPVHARSITFEVQCKTSNGVVRPVGVARIAVSDVLGVGRIASSGVSESCMQVLSYRLRDWEGRRNGVIHFSVRVKTPDQEEEHHRSCSPVKPAENNRMAMSSGGFVSHSEVTGFQVDPKNSNIGVVTGIPVCWSYPNNL